MRVTAILLVLALLPAEAAGQTAPQVETGQTPATLDAATLYAALRDVGFDGARSLTIEDLSLTRGPAVFYFERGVWIPLHAVGGQITGAVFIGDGSFRFNPPPGVEQDQLVKFAGSATLDEAFTALYLRFSDATAQQVASGALAEGQRGDVRRARKMHDKRREELLDKQKLNLEARILTDLVNDRHDSFFAWIETREQGLLSFRIDSSAPDLYTLAKWTNRYGGMLNTWSAFGPEPLVAAYPLHYALDMTLDGEELVEGRAELRLQATEPGRAALRFMASPLLELREVLDATGAPLFFAREKVGRKDWERAITVAFPSALPTDAAATVTFVYGGDILDSRRFGEFALKAPIGWYPTLGDLERATYEVTFRVDEKRQVFVSGELVSNEVVDDLRVVRFRQDVPVALMSFNYGSMPTESVQIDGAPPITVFGRSRGGGTRLRDIGIDVGNSLNYFSEMFGAYPFSYMYATRIPYAHGQGFPGLLHLAAGSFNSEVKGATEAFRGHEVAHQWWGHIVGWKTYRDQWISEGFAEYSGALYAAMYHQDDEVLERMTGAWRNDILGQGNIRAMLGFDRYGFPPQMMRFSKGSASGPISIGRRLRSGEAPIDYNILVYEKGAYVLHMLRMMFYDFRAGNDEPFCVMMRDFVETHRGGEASTDDFRRVVERHAGADMGWFFDQWVYGTAIPTYRYAWTTERGADGGHRLKLRVRQTVEPDGPFEMLVLVRVEFGEGRSSVVRVRVNQPEQIFEFPLPEAPTDVILNHANAVLAKVIKEKW